MVYKVGHLAISARLAKAAEKASIEKICKFEVSSSVES
jgi:hypothetical protein